MTDVTQYFSNESKYLSAGDLPQTGMVRVTISGLEEVDFGKDGNRQIKPVVRFQGHKKALSLNKTNGMAIAQILGPNMDNWIGKEILLYVTTTDYQGDTVPCIRVNMPREEVNFAQQSSAFQQPVHTQQPQRENPAPQAFTDDDVNF